MSWLEIITVRTAGRTEFMAALQLCRHLQHDLEAEGAVRVLVYRSSSFETDLGVYLYWDLPTASPAKSDAGIRLSKSLTSFGLIDHKILQLLEKDKVGVIP
jgi:hypothetical protein